MSRMDTSMRLGFDISARLQKAYTRINLSLYRYGFRSPRKLFLPDFLGIGIEKAGTTWLYENLRCHPDVFMSRQKELNYFDRDIRNRDLKFYSSNFRDAGEKMKGEITPGYAYLTPACISFIRSIMPDARLIFIMRHPIEQQWSFAFHQLVRRPGISIEDVPEHKFLDFFTKTAFYKAGGYTGILDNWLSHFPAEKMHVDIYRNIKKQPRKFLEKLFNYLDISLDIDWKSLPYEKIIVPPAGPQYRGLDGGRGVIDSCHRRSDAFMPVKYRTFLEKLYEKEIKMLHQRFGKKVSSWVNV
jgi:hypothetical protein